MCRIVSRADNTFVLEQFKDAGGVFVARSFDLSPEDLAAFVHWLRGSYSAQEWPPSRRFTHGVVEMMPNPRPHLELHWHDKSKPQSTCTTFIIDQADLIPLVEWLSAWAPPRPRRASRTSIQTAPQRALPLDDSRVDKVAPDKFTESTDDDSVDGEEAPQEPKIERRNDRIQELRSLEDSQPLLLGDKLALPALEKRLHRINVGAIVIATILSGWLLHSVWPAALLVNVIAFLQLHPSHRSIRAAATPIAGGLVLFAVYFLGERLKLADRTTEEPVQELSVSVAVLLSGVLAYAVRVHHRGIAR